MASASPTDAFRTVVAALATTPVAPVARRVYRGISAALVDLHGRAGSHRYQLVDRNVVLAFHGVGEDPDRGFVDAVPTRQFRRIVRSLAGSFELVPLAAVTDGHPGGRVAITFDDGLASVYDNALPVLREFDVPATVFVTPGLVDDRKPDLIAARHGIQAAGGVMLTDAQLRELADSPLVSIGNHTMTHRDLRRVAGPAERQREIVEARDLLEDRYGVAVEAFCYPYGAVDAAARRVVERTHGRSVTTTPLLVGPDQGPHGLPRVNGNNSIEKLRWELTAASDLLHRMGLHD